MKTCKLWWLMAVIGAVFLLAGCSSHEPEGFALYLTAEKPQQTTKLTNIPLEPEPIISLNDIESYDVATHEIQLKASAFERISKLGVPVQGRYFVACVDKKPVYPGAFWTPVSSLSYDGIIIMKPFSLEKASSIKIDTGYPSSQFFAGKDLRSDPAIIKSLKRAGKLR